MDCFAEPVIGRRFAPTRWLAMTIAAVAGNFLVKAADAKKGPDNVEAPFRLLVVVMNDGLAAIAVLILFLDHGRPVTWFVLLDDRGPVTITINVTIVGFAGGYAGSDRPDPDANLVREGWCGNGADNGGNKQIFLHVHPPES
jgi:hypothetical protein